MEKSTNPGRMYYSKLNHKPEVIPHFIFNLLASYMLILFFLSFNIFIYTTPFDSSRVLKNIKYLSSEGFKGRLAGTFENEEAAVFIENQFKNNGIAPFLGSYFQSFNEVYPVRTEGIPYLKVTDPEGTPIKEYIYGTDYKEDMLSFRSNSFSFSRKSKLYMAEDSLGIQSDNNKYVFYVSPRNSLDFRSSFSRDAKFDMYIMINASTLKDMKEYLNKGFTISCFIPFTSKEGVLNNVTAEIKGKNPFAPAIVLAAHFDHVGSDLKNRVYYGALDNASGVSFVLELSKFFKSLGQPDRNIIFAGFNGEELGCRGSEAFAKGNKEVLKGATVYNFDMVGGGSFSPLSIMAGKGDSPYLPIIKSIKSTCTRENIPFNYIFENSSDHESFRKENIDAITLTDHDTTNIHTTRDTAEAIETKNIERCFSVISQEIIHNAYSCNPIVMFNREILIISFVGIILMLLVKFKVQDL